MAPCACGAKKNGSGKFVVISPSGDKKTYSTEVEAAAAAKRTGGTYKPA